MGRGEVVGKVLAFYLLYNPILKSTNVFICKNEPVTPEPLTKKFCDFWSGF